ncbi:MAG: type II secretion system F family protein [bacterium]
MNLIVLFLGFFGVFLLILYGLGVIRILPKNLSKAVEQKQKSIFKKPTTSPTSIITAKIRATTTPDDDSVPLIQRLDDMLFIAGIQMPFTYFLGITLPIAGLIALILFQGLGFSLSLALPMGLALWLIGVNVILKRKQKKRRDFFEKEFVDVVATIARAISVGASLQESFRIVCEEFSGPVYDEFNRMRQDILLGRTPQQAITQAANRLQLQDFDFFALSVVTQIESGGNLGKSLDSLRETIINRQMLVRQLKIKTANAKFQTGFFICLPFVVGIGMYIFDRQTLMYFMSPKGEEQGIALLVWVLLGILIIRHMNKKALDG